MIGSAVEAKGKPVVASTQVKVYPAVPPETVASPSHVHVVPHCEEVGVTLDVKAVGCVIT